MTDRVWLVTGASRGFGAEISQAVLIAGEKLVATARTMEGLEELGTHANLFPAVLDVTNESQAEDVVQRALGYFGRVDVLVNNAGITMLGAVEESSADDVERLYRTNVFGLLNVTRAVLPSMRQRRSGHVINLSSIAGYRAYEGFGVYSSTKSAVEGLSEALYTELRPLGIHVTVVEPGFFRTDILEPTLSLLETANRISDYDETAGAMRAAVPTYNHQQPGDPVKFAQALMKLVDAADPPLRLPLGTDTLARIAEKSAVIERETSDWRTVAESTDF